MAGTTVGDVSSVDFTGISLLVKYNTCFSSSVKEKLHALNVVVTSLAEIPKRKVALRYKKPASKPNPHALAKLPTLRYIILVLAPQLICATSLSVITCA